MNVASYDNYMLIKSHLTFSFLLCGFFYDNLLQLGANDLIKCENLVASVKHFVSESHNLFFFFVLP